MTNVVMVIPTTLGNNINPVELWDMATASMVRVGFGNCKILAPDVFDNISGYVFVLSAATLRPQLPRSTRFPAAQ